MTANPLQKKIQGQAYRLVMWQLIGVVVFALIALSLNGTQSGYSVLLGGLAYGLPNLGFVWGVFRFSGAQQMNQFMVAFFFGEMLKLILCAIFVLIIVKYLPVSLLSVLAGFAGAMISFWIVSFQSFSRAS